MNGEIEKDETLGIDNEVIRESEYICCDDWLACRWVKVGWEDERRLFEIGNTW